MCFGIIESDRYPLIKKKPNQPHFSDATSVCTDGSYYNQDRKFKKEGDVKINKEAIGVVYHLTYDGA